MKTKNIDYDKAIERAEGNAKHEGMHLTDYERKIIRQSLTGEIFHKEFLKLAYEEAIK